MKLTKWMAATALFLSFGVAGCTDDITDEVSQLTRNTDEVSVAYNKDATARISVRVPGAWSASVACKDAAGQETAAWLRLDPAEGVGNGKDYHRGRYARRCRRGEGHAGRRYLHGEKTRAFGRPESQCRIECAAGRGVRQGEGRRTRRDDLYVRRRQPRAGDQGLHGNDRRRGQRQDRIADHGNPLRYRRGETQHENDHRGQDDLRRRDFAQYPVREFHLLDGLRQIRLGRRPDGQ